MRIISVVYGYCKHRRRRYLCIFHECQLPTKSVVFHVTAGSKPESVIRNSGCFLQLSEPTQSTDSRSSRLLLQMSYNSEPLPSQPVIVLAYSKCQHMRVSLHEANLPFTYLICGNALPSVQKIHRSWSFCWSYLMFHGSHYATL